MMVMKKMTLIEKTKYYELHEDNQGDIVNFGVQLYTESGQLLFNIALQNQYVEGKAICRMWQENHLLKKQLDINIV